MKRFFKMCILVICFLIASLPVFASDMLISPNPTYNAGIAPAGIRVQLNGEYLDFTDESGNVVEPKILNNRTMVPVRKIFEELGAEVSYEPTEKVITAYAEKLQIVLQIGNTNATVTRDGEVKNITLDSAPVIMDNRTLVPVRFIAESMDKKVSWDPDYRTVIIIEPEVIENSLKELTPNFYEYLTTEFTKLTTADMDMDINCNLKLENSKNPSENGEMKLTGETNIKLSETAFYMNINLKVKGEGAAKEALEEQNLESVKMDIVADLENKILYMKSELFDEFGYKNKWLKYDMSEDLEAYEELMKSFNVNKNYSNIVGLLEDVFTEYEADVNTYSEMNEVLMLLPYVVGDDYFKVLGKEGNKTYTFNFDLVNLVGRLTSEDYADYVQQLKDMLNIKLGFESKIKNNIEESAKANFEFTFNYEGQKLEMDVGVDAKLNSYNKTLNIDFPKQSEVVDITNMMDIDSVFSM